MAYSLTDLTGRLRAALLDTVAPYLFTDASLQQAIADAVNEHSFFYPRSVRTLYDVATGQQEWALYPLTVGGVIGPTSDVDLIAVVGVEFPAGTPIPLDGWGSTPAAPTTSSRTANGYRWTEST